MSTQGGVNRGTELARTKRGDACKVSRDNLAHGKHLHVTFFFFLIIISPQLEDQV